MGGITATVLLYITLAKMPPLTRQLAFIPTVLDGRGLEEALETMQQSPPKSISSGYRVKTSCRKTKMPPLQKYSAFKLQRRALKFRISN